MSKYPRPVKPEIKRAMKDMCICGHSRITHLDFFRECLNGRCEDICIRFTWRPKESLEAKG